MIIKNLTCSITLYTKTQTGTDDFGRPEYSEIPVTIDNVVIGQPSSDDIVTEINLSGKRISYILSLPADDSHDWENVVVEFWGKQWRTIGTPREFRPGFMGADFPWNKQIAVEWYSDDTGTIQAQS